MKIVDKFDIECTKTFRIKPDRCPYCTSRDVQGVEILGAYDGELMWECSYCHKFILKFTKRTTEKHLKKAQELLIDVSNWEELWEQLPN